MGFIYKITNSVNDKIYVGKTTMSIEDRWKLHIRETHRPRKYKSLLYDAMEKYGIDKFHIEPIEECDNTVLDDRERYWIAHYDTRHTGYNLTLGGDGHNIIGDEEKAEIIRLWNEGLTQKEISEAINRNHKLVKRIIYESGTTRAEVIRRQTLKTRPSKSKPIYAYDLDGNFLKEYSTTIGAAEELHINRWAIHDILRGRRKTVGGMTFRTYKSEKIDPVVFLVNPKTPVYQYSLDGDFIREYPTTKDALNAVGLKDHHGIRNSCNSCKTISGGYQWRWYKTDKIGKATGWHSCLASSGTATLSWVADT